MRQRAALEPGRVEETFFPQRKQFREIACVLCSAPMELALTLEGAETPGWGQGAVFLLRPAGELRS